MNRAQKLALILVGLVAFGVASGAVWQDANAVVATFTNATSLAAVTTNNVISVAPYAAWNANHQPAAATKATISKAAGGGTVRHVLTGFLACEAFGSTAQTIIFVNIRDGATGAGTVLWSAPVIEAAAGVPFCVGQTGLSLLGTANTAMTIEFSAAGATNTLETVAMQGYSIP